VFAVAANRTDAQPLSVCTSNVPLPPAGGTDPLVGLIANVHP
jgi:hypothetical protein